MSYYNKCQYCSNNLDPGEHCDCQEEEQLKKKRITKMMKQFIVGNDGQMVLGGLNENNEDTNQVAFRYQAV